jgi:broad specificity phosphatase PhoE
VVPGERGEGGEGGAVSEADVQGMDGEGRGGRGRGVNLELVNEVDAGEGSSEGASGRGRGDLCPEGGRRRGGVSTDGGQRVRGLRLAVWSSPHKAAVETAESLLRELRKRDVDQVLVNLHAHPGRRRDWGDEDVWGGNGGAVTVAGSAVHSVPQDARVRVAWALRGRGWGEWEGLSVARVAALSKRQLERPGHGLEPLPRIRTRVKWWLQRCEAKLKGYVVLVVASPPVLQILRDSANVSIRP